MLLSRTRRRRRKIPARVKKQVLKRDARRCRKCGSTRILHVDHIVPVSRGGDNGLRNLQILCSTCNLEKGSKVGALRYAWWLYNRMCDALGIP